MMEKFMNCVITPVIFVYLVGITSAHVALTFPPARKLDLDFLDFFRTKMPCGMPKGKYRTTFKAGSDINVTWHLAYPHRGGFRVELLDKYENVTMKLSEPSSNNSYISGDPTIQWHTVTLPDTPCEDCTLRLLREANEWKGYGYWSCADISIVKQSDYSEDCLGRGKVSQNSICSCDKGFWGPRCQYKDECDTDNDCGNGKCIDIGGTSLPRKQCYCSAGYHGEHCQLQNKDTLPTPENLQLSSHKKTVLSDRMTLYHRIVDTSVKDSDKEMEFVLIVNGTSYGAIGWRPSSLDRSCQSMPAIDDDMNTHLIRHTRAAKSRPHKSNPTLLEPLHMNMPEKIMAAQESSMNSKRSTKGVSQGKPEPEPETSASAPEPEPEPEKHFPEAVPEKPSKYKSDSNKKKNPKSTEPKSEPEAHSEPHSEPEATSEPKSEPEAHSEPHSEPEVSSEPKSEPEASSEPKSEPEASSEPKSEPEASTEPESEPEASSEPKSEPEASSEPKSEPEASSEPKSEPEASSEPKSEPEASSEPESEPEASSEPKSEPKASGEPQAEPESTKETQTEKSSSKPGRLTKPKSSSKSKRQPEPIPTFESAAVSQSEPESYESIAAVAYAEPELHGKKLYFDDPSPYKLEKKNTSYTPMLDSHPMDCSDIVIGTAKGMHSRIRDYYTRDRSTPRLDTFYGGTEDIISAVGWEVDGITTIIFRRKIKTADPTDHDLSGSMKVIFARGQEHGAYAHTPKSGLETENPSIPNFYAQDELKYHGNDGQINQRGVTIINF